MIGIVLDTSFYNPATTGFFSALRNPIITPLNSLLYNINSSNLALHGLHPYYQHIAYNLPQLLGPATLLLMIFPRRGLRLYSALSGIIVLSLFRHQEARFLIPTIPLILSSVSIPKRYLRPFMILWVLFNVTFGILMGVFHQGGVVPTQMWLESAPEAQNVRTVLWWKTYSPPIWLLDGRNGEVATVDLMGMKPDEMVTRVLKEASCRGATNDSTNDTFLVAPYSATYLDKYVQAGDGGAETQGTGTLILEKTWMSKRHLNLDDMDFGDDGVWPTLHRVVGRRGIVAWKATKDC
jgi:GPI mannosyltransferase 4